MRHGQASCTGTPARRGHMTVAPKTVACSCRNCWDGARPPRNKLFHPSRVFSLLPPPSQPRQTDHYMQLIYQYQSIHHTQQIPLGLDSPLLAVTQAVPWSYALLVLNHNPASNSFFQAYRSPALHDAPLMLTIGERANRGLDDPVVPTLCLSRIPSTSAN